MFHSRLESAEPFVFTPPIREKAAKRPGMFRRIGRPLLFLLAAVLAVFLFLCPAHASGNTGTAAVTNENVLSYAPGNTLQADAARTYAAALLGGDRTALGALPMLFPPDTEGSLYRFLWTRELAFPASTWAWGQATDVKTRSVAKGVLLSCFLPDTAAQVAALARSENAPLSAAEWMLLSRMQNPKFVMPPLVRTERVLGINSMGQVTMGGNSLSAWFAAPESLFLEALQWFASHPSKTPKELLKKSLADAEAATFYRLSPSVMGLWRQVVR